MKKIIFVGPFSYSKESGYETEKWMKDAFVKKGIEVIRFDDIRACADYGVDGCQKLLLEAVTVAKPDAVVFIKPDHITPETFQAIKCKTIIYHPDVRDSTEKWLVERAKHADHLFVMNIGSVDKYRFEGCNCHYVAEAADVVDHYANYEAEKKYDIVFIGSVRDERIPMLKALINRGYNIAIYGNLCSDWYKFKYYYKGAIYGKEHSKVCNAAKICITWDWCPDVENSWSARIYRVMSTSCLYMSKYVNGMSEVFRDSISTFDDLTSMFTQIDYILKEEDYRIEKCKKANDLIRNEHTFDHRIEEILKIVGE